MLHLLIGVGIISIPAGLLASALSKARELEDAANRTLPKPIKFTPGPCEIKREWMNLSIQQGRLHPCRNPV